MHHRNIQTLVIEIYKHIHGLSQATMRKVSKLAELYLRTHNEFFSSFPKAIKYGAETISFLAPKVPGKVKECSCSEAFKSILNLKSGNQIAHTSYAQLIWNTLVFFNYAHMYIQYKCTFSVNIHI